MFYRSFALMLLSYMDQGACSFAKWNILRPVLEFFTKMSNPGIWSERDLKKKIIFDQTVI